MTNMTNIIGGGRNLLNKNPLKGKLTDKQLNDLKEIGHCIIATSNKEGVPHCTIVEPSYYFEDEIIIPVIQLVFSYENIKENSNIFIHVTKINEESFGDSTQYKINAIGTIETSGEMFEKVKHFEETERLPEDLKVRAIIRAKLVNVVEVLG